MPYLFLTLLSHAHLLPLLVRPHPRLCLRVLNHLAADPQNGIMITVPTLKFSSDSKPGGNTSLSGTTTDAVTDTMDLGSTVLTSQGFAQIWGNSTFPSEV